MRLKTVILLACLCVLTVAPTAFAQQGPAVGNITSAGATCSATSPSTNCVTLKLDGLTGAATILITNTFVGTAQFEVSNDGLTTWTNINCTPPNSTTAASSATSTGSWQCNVAGWEHIRVRCSAYTSGTISVVINGAHASAKSGGGAVYASGLGTSNVIPKGNGAGQLADSSCTDNATTVTCTERFVAPTSSTVAQLSDTASNGSGFAISGGSQWGISSGSRRYGYDGTAFTAILGSGWQYAISSTTDSAAAADLFLGRRGAANWRLGTSDVNGTPVDQTISVQNAITGTDLPGGHTVIDAPLGTGLGAAAKTCINRTLMGAASGATAQTSINGFCIGETKKLSNTSAQAQSLVNISVPSNSSGGAQGAINVSCNDGTNYDSETNTFFVSYVNKAGVLTVGTAQLGTASTANNSGSCTTAITVTAGTNSVDIKVTPVITTIVPTTTTGTILSLSTYGTGNPTYN